MKRTISCVAFIAVLTVSSVVGQSSAKSKPYGPSASASAAAMSPAELANAAVAAHGGDKLKKMRSLLMKGSVDLSVFNQSMPGAFSTAISGDKYFLEIVSAVQQLKQVYDGTRTYSSIQGFSLPPITSLGFPLLPRVGDPGYVVSAFEGKKKQRGFRITTPEGFYTDFVTDEKTNQIKGYESSYDVGGRVVTTSVEVKSYEVIDGVTIPKNYSQRFDLGTMTAYAAFKTKTIQVNTPIEDSAFALEK